MGNTENTRPSDENARKLAAYFEVYNPGDEARWEKAFDLACHPEAIVHGKTFAQLKDWHRSLLGKVRVENVQVIREIDADQFEYKAEAGGKPVGPFVAVFKDGRVLRVFEPSAAQPPPR